MQSDYIVLDRPNIHITSILAWISAFHSLFFSSSLLAAPGTQFVTRMSVFICVCQIIEWMSSLSERGRSQYTATTRQHKIKKKVEFIRKYKHSLSIHADLFGAQANISQFISFSPKCISTWNLCIYIQKIYTIRRLHARATTDFGVFEYISTSI